MQRAMRRAMQRCKRAEIADPRGWSAKSRIASAGFSSRTGRPEGVSNFAYCSTYRVLSASDGLPEARELLKNTSQRPRKTALKRDAKKRTQPKQLAAQLPRHKRCAARTRAAQKPRSGGVNSNAKPETTHSDAARPRPRRTHRQRRRRRARHTMKPSRRRQTRPWTAASQKR